MLSNGVFHINIRTGGIRETSTQKKTNLVISKQLRYSGVVRAWHPRVSHLIRMASIGAYILGALLCYLGIAFLRALHSYSTHKATANTTPATTSPGLASKAKGLEITLEELQKYTGQDGYRPLALAIRGTIYDVSSGVSFYGVGKPYGVYAGKEVSRALGKMSLEEKDCHGDVSDLSEKEMATLEQWEAKFRGKYPVLGRVVPSLELTSEALRAYDGRDGSKPMLVSIRGVLFDVSSATAFYGPDGAYPFAGRECARALGTYSTAIEDCTGDVGDLRVSEMDALRGWEAQFHMKYKVVGRLKE
jgi:membrane-associated progesterone receptor component